MELECVSSPVDWFWTLYHRYSMVYTLIIVALAKNGSLQLSLSLHLWLSFFSLSLPTSKPSKANGTTSFT